jgi:hypothetical protein
MDRCKIILEASDLITSDRAKDYGDAHQNFLNISKGWSVIFGVNVAPEKVALAMDWLKTCRLINSPKHVDSWIDKVGYSALGGEVAIKED